MSKRVSMPPWPRDLRKTKTAKRWAGLVAVHLSPQALSIVDRLLESGLHGRNRSDALERIVDRALVEFKAVKREEWEP